MDAIEQEQVHRNEKGEPEGLAPIEKIEREQLRSGLPDLRPGDTVRVHVRVVEGEKERIQPFQGVVIRRTRGGNRAMFTVRKVSYGVGVERTFPLHSPRIERIEILSRGRVRRARLYYLRGLSGKKARIAEKRPKARPPAARAAGASDES